MQPPFPTPSPKALLSLFQALTSVVALYLGWRAFSIDTNEPQLEISSPKVLRVEFSNKYKYIYAQPIFIVMNPTKKVAVVKDLCLRIQPAGAPKLTPKSFSEACRDKGADGSMLLRWDHIAKFDWDTQRDMGVYEEMVSDALPMPVSIGNPQAPMAGFAGTAAQQGFLVPNRCYRATIYSLSAPRDQLLSNSFHFMISPQQLKALRAYSQQAPFHPHHITLTAFPEGGCPGGLSLSS